MKQPYLILLLFIFFMTASYVQVQGGIFNKKTDSLKIVFDQHQLVLPGESFKIDVISYHKKGKIRKTKGMKGGTALWWRYKTEVMGGKSSGGKITVSSKLLPSKGKYIRVKVWPRKQEELAQTMLIPLNFETALVCYPTTSFNKAPGCSFKVQVVATFDNGRQLTYKNLQSGASKASFNIYTNGIYRTRSKFQIDSDFRNIVDHKVHMKVHSKRNPEVSNTYSVLLDYKHNYNLSFQGSSGFSGFNGSDGSIGISGGNGSQGSHGCDGQPGGDGPDIGVWTDNYYDSTLHCNLLYIYAENFHTGKEYYYLVNPKGGSFTASTCGGSGGRGGDGGDGGDGGRGADGRIWYETVTKTRIVKKPFTKTITEKVKKRRTTGTGEEEEYEETITKQVTEYRDVEESYQVKIKHQGPGEDGGNGAYGGAGGVGGPGGWGGNVYLYFTDDSRQYKDRIIAQSNGGSGGSHGDGGDGGRGGYGGSGNPDGNRGCDGGSGPELMGWAPDGRGGEIFIDSSEEFFFYNEEVAVNNKNSNLK